MKICTRCGSSKTDKEFAPDRRRKSGLQSQCRDCQSEAASHRYVNDPEYRKKTIQRVLDKYANDDRYRDAKKNRERERYHGPEHDRLVAAIKSQHLIRRYGITLAEKLAMIEAQHGLCALCGEPIKNSKDAHVDHDHTTGAIRGILHQRCNQGIGLLRDDPDLCLLAVEYLISNV